MGKSEPVAARARAIRVADVTLYGLRSEHGELPVDRVEGTESQNRATSSCAL
jgi:hypothetical protein